MVKEFLNIGQVLTKLSLLVGPPFWSTVNICCAATQQTKRYHPTFIHFVMRTGGHHPKRFFCNLGKKLLNYKMIQKKTCVFCPIAQNFPLVCPY